MADHLVDSVIRISTSPQEDAAFDPWLTALDAVEFLKANVADEDFVFYATPRQTFIHTVLVPADNVNPPDVEDLMSWSFNAYGSWGVSYTLSDTPEIRLDSPFERSGTKSFERATRLIFPRDFEGRVGDKHYWEILQPFAHAFGLHYVEERNAFCRLDENGDVEDFVRIVSVKAVKWQLIERQPCVIRLLPFPKSAAHFHDFDAYERLVSAAERAYAAGK